MKVLAFVALFAVARAGFVGHHGAVVGHAVVAHAAEAGHSTQHRSQDLAGNYNFGYNEQHTSGGTFRQESGDAWGNKAGSYGLRDADGRVRVVKYVADGLGFRAHVATNEPGTAASTPAAASYNAGHAKVAVAAAAPVAAYAAPVAAYAAPVAAYAAPVARYGVAAPVAAYGVGHYGYPAHAGYGHGLYGAGYGLVGGYGHGLYGGYAGFGYGHKYLGGTVQTFALKGMRKTQGKHPDSTVGVQIRTQVTPQFQHGTTGAERGKHMLQAANSSCTIARTNMKAIILLAVVAVAHAGYFGGHVAHVAAPAVAAAAEAGSSNSHRAQDLAGNYNFGYNEVHTSGGSSRQETGDAYGNKAGSYSLRDADGRVRVVKYVADAAGFRASVSTNEPGTAPSTPAAAGYNAPVVAPAPVAVAAAPLFGKAYAAPVAAYATAPVAAYAAPVAPVHAAHVYGAAVGGPFYGAAVAPAAKVYGAGAYGAYGLGGYGLGYGAHVKHFF
ncbi:shematrin-like protein 1 [Ornithodoros turicata]|uniref:shematrin-like protein 1 n=1 Tax=Ornithodoros turicata TaxID=34597 RepID=UPI003139DEA3